MLSYFINKLKDNTARCVIVPDFLKIEVQFTSEFAQYRAFESYLIHHRSFFTLKTFRYLAQKASNIYKGGGKIPNTRIIFALLRCKYLIFKNGYDYSQMYEMITLYPLLKTGTGYRLLRAINKKPKNIVYRILAQIIRITFRVHTVYIKHILDDKMMKVLQSDKVKNLFKSEIGLNPDTEFKPNNFYN